MNHKKVTIVVIGDEILLGRVVDTNSGAIARAVDRLGCKTTQILTIGDTESEIREAVVQSLAISDIVFTTGGLGPTKDDKTKKVLAEIFGGNMVRNAAVTDNIRRIFAGRNLKLNQLTLDQTLVPSSANIIQNVYGTAPVMVFQKGERMLVSLPGVPYEMEGMLPEVIAYLQREQSVDENIHHSTWVVTEMSESALSQKLEEFETCLPRGLKLAYLPDSPVIKLRLDGNCSEAEFRVHEKLLDDKLKSIKELTILGRGEKSLAEIAVETLATKNLSLATAESCTGGNIAHVITSVSGASAVFNGGVVSYANSTKISLLDVGADTLKAHGAVSRPVVVQMADGASRALATDCAIATSGIAGPTGGTPDKPVGTVWIAVKTPQGITAECFRFPGKRSQVIARATAKAIIMLLKTVNDM